MVSISKNYIYKGGILIFDIRDYGTSVFLKYRSDLLYLKSLSLKVDALESCDAYADMFAREHELGAFVRSYIYLKLSFLDKSYFMFSGVAYNGLCSVDYTIGGRVFQNRVVYCNPNNFTWMVAIANQLYQMDYSVKVQNYHKLIKGTTYESLLSESSSN